MDYALKLTEDNVEVISNETNITFEGINFIQYSHLMKGDDCYFILEKGDMENRKILWASGKDFKDHYEFIGPENLTKFIPVKRISRD